ncbi:MAG TPA: haloacid dehalogenase-like hydrolase [Elusimicrobiota bacterium]|nr:haloacid dehalogenase-like hydrolase [Elusimicrobiota bacterium]
MAEDPIPLCVDLDGTLVRGDLSLKASWIFVKRGPLNALRLGLWFLRGRAYLKARLSERVTPDWDALAYHRGVLDWLRTEHLAGRRLILVSGSPRAYVGQLAERLGFFTDFAGSEGGVNLVGRRKRRWLLESFGVRGYDYVGNSRWDAPIFAKARRAYLVSDDPRVLAAARRRASDVVQLPPA